MSSFLNDTSVVCDQHIRFLGKFMRPCVLHIVQLGTRQDNPVVEELMGGVEIENAETVKDALYDENSVWYLAGSYANVLVKDIAEVPPVIDTGMTLEYNHSDLGYHYYMGVHLLTEKDVRSFIKYIFTNMYGVLVNSDIDWDNDSVDSMLEYFKRINVKAGVVTCSNKLWCVEDVENTTLTVIDDVGAEVFKVTDRDSATRLLAYKWRVMSRYEQFNTALFMEKLRSLNPSEVIVERLEDALSLCTMQDMFVDAPNVMLYAGADLLSYTVMHAVWFQLCEKYKNVVAYIPLKDILSPEQMKYIMMFLGSVIDTSV